MNFEGGSLVSAENSLDYNTKPVEETGTLRLPESVTSIGEGAFANVEGLKTLKIPHSVKTITSNAFAGMENIKEININNEENSIQGAPWACPAGMRVIIWNS